jgi:CheY-like chemotaxis protein
MNALLIDDSSLYHALIVEVLRFEGITIRMVSDAELLRDALKSTQYDLVFCDPYLRGIDGLDLVAKLRERFPSLPIIALTRYSSDAQLQQQILQYTSYTLVKPFTIEALLRIIREVVGFRNSRIKRTATSAV